MPMSDIYQSPTARRLQDQREQAERERLEQEQQEQRLSRQQLPSLSEAAASAAPAEDSNFARSLNDVNNNNSVSSSARNNSSGSVPWNNSATYARRSSGLDNSLRTSGGTTPHLVPSGAVHEVQATVPLPMAYVLEQARRQRVMQLAEERGVSVDAFLRSEGETNPYGEPVAYLSNNLNGSSGSSSSSSSPSPSEDENVSQGRLVASINYGEGPQPATTSSSVLHKSASADRLESTGARLPKRPSYAKFSSRCSSRLGDFYNGDKMTLDEHGNIVDVDGGVPLDKSMHRWSAEALDKLDADVGRLRSERRSTSASINGEHHKSKHHKRRSTEEAAIAGPETSSATGGGDRLRVDPASVPSDGSIPNNNNNNNNTSFHTDNNTNLTGNQSHNYLNDLDGGSNSEFSYGIPMATARRTRSTLQPGARTPGGRTLASATMAEVEQPLRHALSLSDLEAMAAAGPATGTVLTQNNLDAQQQQLLERRRQIQQDRLRQIEGLRRHHGGSILPGRAPPATGKHPRRCACGGYKPMGRGYLEPYCLQRKNDCNMQ